MVAVLAAVALVLHLAVAGFVEGAMAAVQAAGGSDAPVCSAHDHSQTPHAPNKPGRSHLADCCVAACSVAAGTALTAHVPVLLPSTTRSETDLRLPTYQRPAQRLDRPTLNPRAPPAIA